MHGEVRGVDVAAAAGDQLVPVEGEGAAEEEDGEEVAEGPEQAGGHEGPADDAEAPVRREQVQVQVQDRQPDAGH